MNRNRTLVYFALSLVGCASMGLGAACSSSDNTTNPPPDSGTDSSTPGVDSGAPGVDSGSTPPPDSGPPPGTLIDDMSNPSAQIKLTGLPMGQQAGFWFSFSDVPTNVFVPPLNSPFTYTTVTPPTGVTSTHAACLSAGTWHGYAAGEGFNFVVTATAADAAADASATPLTFDISKFTGISYWSMTFADAGTAGIKVSLPDDNTHGAVPTSTCHINHDDAAEPGQCDDDWSIQSEPVTGTWTHYTHPWSDFVQQGYGGNAGTFMALDEQHVYGINFQVSDPPPNGTVADAGDNPPVGFCIADIQFTK